MRADLYELKSDIVWSRFALTVVGAIAVVTGTFLPFDQFVVSLPNSPIIVQNQNDWRGLIHFSLTHYPGLAISIAALLTVVLELRAQRCFVDTQRGFRQWKTGCLVSEFLIVTVMASLILFSWPISSQGFALNGQGLLIHGVGSAQGITAQQVVLRGPGAVLSFAGAALIFYEIFIQAVAFWRIRPRIQRSESDRTVAMARELNT